MCNHSNEQTLIFSILFLLVSLMMGVCIHKLEMQQLYLLLANFPIVEEAITTFSSEKVKAKRIPQKKFTAGLVNSIQRKFAYKFTAAFCFELVKQISICLIV